MAESQRGESFSARAWRRLKTHPQGMGGLVIVILLAFTSVTAPLMANDRPIVARYKGEWVAPAMVAYVESWVPWQSLRYELQSWEARPGFFPFAEHYAILEGKRWKEVRESEEMGFALWPPVPWNPNQFDPTVLRMKPGESPGHLLGTDDRGRDVLARLIHGSVVAMLVGVVAMSIATTIGSLLGVTAGYFRGWVDMVLSRIAEVVMCFPFFFLVIAVIAFLEPSIINIMVTLGLISWTSIFRLVRGEVLKTREMEFVTAARALGVPSWRIMTHHLLPNAISPVFVSVAFGIASAVLTETSLSFLGFGDPSMPSWGEIVSQGRNYINQGLWHLAVLPGVAIFITLTGFNLLGQGLRDALDPKLRL